MIEPFTLYPSNFPPKDGVPDVQSWGFKCPSPDLWPSDLASPPGAETLSPTPERPSDRMLLTSLRPSEFFAPPGTDAAPPPDASRGLILFTSAAERHGTPQVVISVRPTMESPVAGGPLAEGPAEPQAERLVASPPAAQAEPRAEPGARDEAANEAANEARANPPSAQGQTLLAWSEKPQASARPSALEPAAVELATTEPSKTEATPPHEHEAPLLAPSAASPRPATAAATRRSEPTRSVMLPVLCAAAAVVGLAFGTVIDASRQAAPIANISGEVTALRAEQGEARAELGKQAATLTETRKTLDRVADRQKEAEAAARAEQARAESEEARLSHEIAATKRAQARTDEHVYKLSEALKLIDWAATGGYATSAVEKASGQPHPARP